MIRNTFTFDTVNSEDYGVFISGDAVFDAPAKEYEMIPIPGRNGDLAVFGNRFENIEVNYPAFIFEEFKANIQGLRNELLSRTGYQRIADTYHPDEFRLGVYQGGLEVDPVQIVTAGEFDITFNCKPQRFLVEGETEQVFTASGTITNPTLFEAKPLLVVTGSGTLGIGSESITITQAAGRPVYIDTDIMDAWTVSGSAKVPYNNYIQYTNNKPPTLSPGQNGVSLGSGITQVAITPRWYRL